MLNQQFCEELKTIQTTSQLVEFLENKYDKKFYNYNFINYESIYFLLETYKCLSGFDFTRKKYAQRFPGKNWISIRGAIKSKILLNHFLHDHIIALPLYYSNNNHYIIIDIDGNHSGKTVNYNTQDIIDNLISEFQQDPFYIEYSEDSNGYHIYFYSKKFVIDDAKKEFEKYFNEKYKCLIEVKRGDQVLRLPLSKKYMIAGTYDKNIQNKVNNLVTNNLESNIKLLIHLFNESKNYNIKIPKFLNKILDIKIPLRHNKYNSNPNNKNVTYDEKKLERLFRYGCGTRHIGQLLIANFCIWTKSDYNKFEQLCHKYNDGTSKDMKNCAHKTMQNVWKCANRRPIPNNSKIRPDFLKKQNQIYFHNPSYHLSNNTYRVYNHYLTTNIQNVLKIKKNGVVYRRYVRDCIKVLTLLQEKIEYRKFKDIKYENSDYKFLEKPNSFPLSQKELKLISKQFNIKNIRKVIHILKSLDLLVPILNDWNKSYNYKINKKYKFSYCIHYTFKNSHILKYYILLINNILLYINNIKQKNMIIYVSKNFFNVFSDGEFDYINFEGSGYF